MQELAWASFVLLKFSNACSVLVVGGSGQRALMARGALGASCVRPGDTDASLAAMAGDLAAAAAATTTTTSSSSSSPGPGEVSAVLGGRQQALWLPDRGAMARAGVDRWACVPSGVQSLLLQPIPGQAGALVVMSERPRWAGRGERGGGAAQFLGACLPLPGACTPALLSAVPCCPFPGHPPHQHQHTTLHTCVCDALQGSG